MSIRVLNTAFQSKTNCFQLHFYSCSANIATTFTSSCFVFKDNNTNKPKQSKNSMWSKHEHRKNSDHSTPANSGRGSHPLVRGGGDRTWGKKHWMHLYLLTFQGDKNTSGTIAKTSIRWALGFVPPNHPQPALGKLVHVQGVTGQTQAGCRVHLT